MTTLFVASSPEDITTLLPWAWHLAASRQEKLCVLLAARRQGETRVVDAPEPPDSEESDLLKVTRSTITELTSQSNSADPAVEIKQILGDNWADDLPSAIVSLKPKFLIARAPSFQKNQTVEPWQSHLMAMDDCEVMLVRDDAAGVHQPLNLAVFVTDEADNESALRCGQQLIDSYGGTVTAVYVQPNVSDDSGDVGERRLTNMLIRLLGGGRKKIGQRVIVAQNTSDAFRELNASDFHLLLMGTRNQSQMRRFFRANPVTEKGDDVQIPAVAVLQRSASMGSRIRKKAVEKLKTVVPQLSREERVHLVTRIQEASQWDFDFVLLISLSTLIACLGLAENSAAVIVGAMLVAPLMTPIAGVGLGVAHANAFLTKVALRTALRGFATAMLIGIAFGFCVQLGHSIGWLDSLVTATSDDSSATFVFSSEVEGRTKPQFYDLLIALASGIAAAYAMGRPNLYSALPGVAIAAALVPPIAVSGIALSYGAYLKSGGALLLFVTNMVTIILGTSLAFSAVGIQSQKDGPNAATWPRWTLLLLVILSICITIIIELNGQHRKQLESQQTQTVQRNSTTMPDVFPLTDRPTSLT